MVGLRKCEINGKEQREKTKGMNVNLLLKKRILPDCQERSPLMEEENEWMEKGRIWRSIQPIYVNGYVGRITETIVGLFMHLLLFCRLFFQAYTTTPYGP